MNTKLALAVLFAVGIASCDNGTNTSTTTKDTTAMPGADPNMVTTTTTTTTTRPAFQPQQGVQYMDLHTKKMVTVRVDTIHHYVVNATTNQPLDFFMAPGSTDTFYGRNMQLANGYINYGSGSNWTYDESRANSSNSGSTDNSNMNNTNTGDNSSSTTTNSSTSATDDQSTTDASNPKKVKIKDENGKTKMKDHGEKVKIKESH